MTASAKPNRSPEGVATPSRREVLNYAFGASIALMLAGSCGGLVWFLQQQRIGYGVKSGLFLIDPADVPKPGDPPVYIRDASAWIANVDGGLVAYSEICPYKGCGVIWAYWDTRFECPCCGSKFQLDGTYIEGPAKRGLDRLVVRVTTRYGTITTPADGSPVSSKDANLVVVDADDSQLILGLPRPEIRPS